MERRIGFEAVWCATYIERGRGVDEAWGGRAGGCSALMCVNCTIRVCFEEIFVYVCVKFELISCASHLMVRF